jgi:hypothetical protein
MAGSPRSCYVYTLAGGGGRGGFLYEQECDQSKGEGDEGRLRLNKSH